MSISFLKAESADQHIPEPIVVPLHSVSPTPNALTSERPHPQANCLVALPSQAREDRITEYLQARSLSTNSQIAYRRDLQHFLRWTPQPWNLITSKQVAQFKAHLLRLDPDTGKRVLSDASVRRILGTLKNLFQWLVASEYVDRNPTLTIQLPKVAEPEAQHLSPEQVVQILSAASETNLPARDLALIHILRHGLRASEVAALNLADYDGQRVKIHQAKSDSKGIVPLDRCAQDHLDLYLSWRVSQGEVLSDDRPILISHSRRNAGERLGYDALRKVIDKLEKAVGFTFHAHQFRHTFATELVLQGMNPYHVMTLTRHRSVQNFRRYTKAADQVAAEQAFRSLERNLPTATPDD